jgi:hypothetical protein
MCTKKINHVSTELDKSFEVLHYFQSPIFSPHLNLADGDKHVER